MLRTLSLWASAVPAWCKGFAFWGNVAVVVALSLTPVAQLPDVVFDVWDKAQHAFGFLVLTVLGLWAYPQRIRAVLLGLLVLGGAIELAQAATGWRQGDGWDWLADAVGVAAGALVWFSPRTARPR